MEFNKSKNAKRIISSGLLLKIITLLLPFVLRTVILRYFDSLYLGMNSLFNSILQVLNLADLGINSAIAFALYKPIAEDNYEDARKLINLFKIAYLIIGGFILIAGLILLPFLGNFISGEIPQGINIQMVYLIRLINIVLGYFFFSYKSSVLIALQKGDKINIVLLLMNILMYSSQIFCLAVLKNYYAFVICMPVTTLTSNLVVALYCDKKYPQFKPKGFPTKETNILIAKKTLALFGHQLGTVVMNSVDNIIISSILGLSSVAVYNNYLTIILAVDGLLAVIASSLTPIIGNSLLTKSKEENRNIFFSIFYFYGATMIFCTTCFICMFQPFITLWLDSKSLLPIKSVFLLLPFFFVQNIRTVVNLYKNASGLWEKDALKPYIEVVIDLVIDIFLVVNIGVDGAIISTIVASFFAYVFEAIVCFKYIFPGFLKKYFFDSILYLLISTASCIASYLLCNLIVTDHTFVLFIFSTLIAIFVSGISIIIGTFWKKEPRYLLRRIKNRKKG